MTQAGDTDLARDYDELAALLQAVRDEEARFRALFESAPSALLVTDRALKILEANRAAEALLEVPLRFLLGKPAAAFVVPESRRAFRGWVVEVGHSGRTAEISVRMQRRSGVLFDAAVRAAPYGDELHWTIVDRSQEAIAEAQLWELNRELEQRVAAQAAEVDTLSAHLPVGVMLVRPDGFVAWANERARALLPGEQLADDDPARPALHGQAVRNVRRALPSADGEERVVEITATPVRSERGGAAVVLADVTDRDRVERADAAFVQNAAHQLRTPITAIVSSVDALEAGARDDPQERERFLAHISREAHRMAQLVDALLTLGSLERGAGRPVVELVPLRGLIDDVVGELRAEVTCEIGIAVVGDRELLRQSLANVVANAVVHGGEPVTIEASLTGATIVLDVTDSGLGVPEEERERIFERFYRAGSPARGSGLGLPIARAAARATRGALELMPQGEGAGATFRFTLPGARLL